MIIVMREPVVASSLLFEGGADCPASFWVGTPDAKKRERKKTGKHRHRSETVSRGGKRHRWGLFGVALGIPVSVKLWLWV